LRAKALHYLSPARLVQLEQRLAAGSAVLPRRGESPDPAEQLAGLNEEVAHVGTAAPQQRKRLEDQYARVAGMLLAGLSGSPSAAEPSSSAALNLDALSQ